MRFYLFFFLLSFNVLQAQPTIPPPTQTDEIIIDNGATGKADPNDRIRYKVTIQNTGTTGATGTQLNIVPDPRTTFVAGTFRSSPLALADSYASTGNVGITIPVASGLKANDFDDNIPGLTITAGTFATTQGGSIMISADGSFMYTPPAGFTGNDTYTYTLNDANGVGGGVPATDMAVITITVSNLIWFIDNSSVAATSDGRLTSPFKSLADFNAGSAAVGDLIYIEHTGTNYTGGIVLQDNERLYGEGHTGAANLSGVLPFTLAPNSKTLPNINGTRPIITNASGDGVTLAMNNNLRGFDVGNCSDFGMDNSGTNSIGNLLVNEVAITNTTGGGFDASNGSGASMSAVFGSITSTGGVNGIDLTNCAGTFTVNGGTITNPTGTGVMISGGSVVFSSSGVITDNSGFAVDIDNHDSGNVTFSGNITSTGTGIRVQNCGGGTKTFSGTSKSLTTTTNNAVNLLSNTGATITISNGGLVINTSSGVGFNATGGATAVNVTGAGNTINSVSATALNVSSTTIGASGMTFQSISSGNNTAAADPTEGIVLNTTGSNGGLSITGTGTTNGSGGTIQNITNRGVSGFSTFNLSLKNMTFTNADLTDAAPCGAADNSGCNAAIFLNTVTNATLDNVDIDGSQQQGINLREVSGFQLLNSTVINTGGGGDTEEAGLYALNLFGTCAITSSSLTFPTERASVIYNTNKTLGLTVTGSTFGMNQAMALGADGFEISSFGTSNTTLDIVNSTFIQPKTNGLQVITEGTSHTSVDVTGSTFDPGPGLAAAMDLVTNASGDMDFNIENNPMIKGKGINIVNVFAFPNSTFEGRINNNTIVHNGGSGAGVRVTNQGNGNSKVEIKSNNITAADDYGITCTSILGTGRLDATVTNNTVSIAASGFYAIHAAAGNSGSTFTNKVCANVANNITTIDPLSIGNFQARAATASHEILLQGVGPSVIANWNANTNSPISPPAIISQSGVGIFTFGATCAIPTNPNP